MIFCFYIVVWWFCSYQAYAVVLSFTHILNFKIWQRVSLCFPGWHVFMTLILVVLSESLDCRCITFLPVLFCLNFYFNMSIYLYMDMYHVSAWSLHWLKDGTRNPELGIMNSCDPPCNSLSQTRSTLYCWNIFPAQCWLFVINIYIWCFHLSIYNVLNIQCLLVKSYLCCSLNWDTSGFS